MTEHYWSFISILTDKRTIDLKFPDRKTTMDFYIAINKSVALVIPEFIPVLNSKFIKISFLRLKIEHMAEIEGLSYI